MHTEGIVPVYPASEQVSARLLRGLVQRVLAGDAPAARPAAGAPRGARGPAARADAVLAVHLPRTPAEAGPPRARASCSRSCC